MNINEFISELRSLIYYKNELTDKEKLINAWEIIDKTCMDEENKTFLSSAMLGRIIRNSEVELICEDMRMLTPSKRQEIYKKKENGYER